ncbi:hypothetical protein B0H21DRAFT_822312 [Amylocystis lapponica]|nr:hypothetical protein B0H21DRAFT_822312 [Amylocystis lapponica]
MPFRNGSSFHDFEHDDEATFVLNPFAGHSETSFSSAVKPKETRPAVRRRGSDGAAKRARNDHDPWRVSHSRAYTMDGERSGDHHPLVGIPSIEARSTYGDSTAHDTRPRLKRLLSDSDPMSSDPDDPVANSGTNGENALRSGQEERVVLVHEILPKDSLAGVALKYGVTLADLRRVNQLWASDSIHLRKVLYIPLEKARHTKQFRALFPDDEAAHAELGQTGDTEDTNRERRDPTLSNVTILRVPASQLSFFPPPSNPIAVAEHTPSKARTLPRPSSSRFGIPIAFTFPSSSAQLASPSTSSPSSPPHAPGFPAPHTRTHNQTLGSLFSAFPIRVNPSKGPFISRVSSESASASPSSHSDDIDWGHEMEDISAASSAARGSHGEDIHTLYHSHFVNTPPYNITAKDRSDVDDIVELDSYPINRSLARTPTGPKHTPSRPSDPLPIKTSRRVDVAYSLPEPPPPLPSSSVVRTAQLEPSPVMQLPSRAQRSKSRDL